jgi:hypothetical protein
VETSAETARVSIENSFLDYGFFVGTEIPDPIDPAEVARLIGQTNMFFSQVFAAEYPDFAGFSAEDFTVTVDNTNENYPIRIEFDAAVDFNEGAPPPTRDEVFTTMQNSDLTAYIQDYVWQVS